MMGQGRIGLILIAAFTVAGCASVIPDALRQQAERIPFEALKAQPEAYRGKMVVLGGEVLEVRYVDNGVELEVIERPLASDQSPRWTAPPGGRFLVHYHGALDSQALEKGRLVTVVGEVIGEEEDVPSLEGRYLYPWRREALFSPSPLPERRFIRFRRSLWFCD